MAKDANQVELENKVNALARSRYGSSTPANIQKLFLSYDKNRDSCLNGDELSALLSDADVGNWITRGFWVDGVMKAIDKDGNRCITWAEYCMVANCGPPPAPAPKPVPVPVTGPPAGGPSGTIQTGGGLGIARVMGTGFVWPSRRLFWH